MPTREHTIHISTINQDGQKHMGMILCQGYIYIYIPLANKGLIAHLSGTNRSCREVNNDSHDNQNNMNGGVCDFMKRGGCTFQ